MDNRLKVDPNDPFFKDIFPKPVGISGGCYSCGVQLHLNFDNLEVLPVAKINKEPYNVLVCDDCEEDLDFLEKNGAEDITYDTLHYLQEEVNEEILNLSLVKSNYTKKDRQKILLKVYNKYEKNFKE